MTWIRKIPFSIWFTIVLVIGIGIYVITHLETGDISRTAGTAEAYAAPGAVKVEQGPAELPQDANFKTVASTSTLDLKLDSTTGHFQVLDKRNGNVWHSYPDQDDWLKESQTGAWRIHLRSPVMFRYIDLSGKLSQPKESNFLDEQGTLKDIKTLPDGFQLTFVIPSKQIEIPVEVRVQNDSVVTKILDEGLKEGKLSLIWIRLYPFFGAEHSNGQDGYLFIPDGSGALIPYDPNSTNVNRVYQVPIFGQDYSFTVNNDWDSRNDVSMPVFGAKSEDRAFLSIVEDGAPYAEILASQSGVFSDYNWITAQQNYRAQYKQVTNRAKNRSFVTYNKDNRFHSDRAVRYILLDKPKADYVGMAERYRQYMMETYGMNKLQPKSNKLPMTVELIGGTTESGMLNDRYMLSTPTSDAMKIVQRLYGLGVDNMVVNYQGWQKDGYTNFGAPMRVDSRLGGDSGMKQFIQLADTYDIPVYLDANYTQSEPSRIYNPKRQGLRDLGGTIIEFDKISLVSLGYLDSVLDKEINYLKGLGAAGVTMNSIGRHLNSDFNTNYLMSRTDSLVKQQDIFKKFQDASMEVRGYRSHFYAVPFLSGVTRLQDDYSYDSFSSTAIPFAQMALHGLVPYTSQYGNERDEYRKQFLRDLEYGSNPAYVFMYQNAEDIKYADGLHFFSAGFQDWETAAVEEYQKLNEALGDVQDQFIVNHRALTPLVKETTYANGKRIIVNYGNTTYSADGISVKPMDYTIVKGGNTR